MKTKPVSNILKEKIIIGVDPGTNVLGFSIIKVRGRKLELTECDVMRMDKQGDHFSKLKKIYSGLRKVITRYHPHEMAIEAPFFGKNVQSMLKLGRAQGTAITAALSENLEVFEYSPRKIKQAITGNGNASKEQVASILSHLLNFDSEYLLLDATDALAVAVCHHFQSNSVAILQAEKNKNGYLFKGKAKRKSDWGRFIAMNPQRIIAR